MKQKNSYAPVFNESGHNFFNESISERLEAIYSALRWFLGDAIQQFRQLFFEIILCDVFSVVAIFCAFIFWEIAEHTGIIVERFVLRWIQRAINSMTICNIKIIFRVTLEILLLFTLAFPLSCIKCSVYF